MKKRIFAVLLALTMVVTGIYVTQPVANEAWAADTKKISDEITPDTANQEMLAIKMQASREYTNSKEQQAVDLRIVTSVNGLGYSYVGFKVWYGNDITIGEDGTVTLTPKATATYKTESVTKRLDASKYKYSPKVVDTSSEYFVTATIEGILTKNFDKNFYIQAYCMPLASAENTDMVYGEGKLFNVGQATESINIAVPQGELSGTEITNVTVNDKPATAKLAGYYDGKAHLYVDVDGGKTSLPSASKIVVGEGENAPSAIYRNLESDYTGNNPDTSWYKTYIAENPDETEFVIATDADLYGFANADTNFSGKTIYMVADIDANDGKGIAAATTFTRSDDKDPYAWAPIGKNTTNANTNFAGTFDGQMHTISGVYLSKTGTANGSWGLFGETGLCTIQNLILSNSSLVMTGIANNNNLGTVAGKSVGIFDTIKVDNAVFVTHGNGSKTDYTGGIVGWMSGTVENGSKISNCQFSGQITASDIVGGILGAAVDNNGSNASTQHKKAVEIENCLNNGQIVLNANGNYIGGICGHIDYSQVEMDNSLNVATIDLVDNQYTVSEYAGTLIGRLRANYNATGLVNGEGIYAAIINHSYGISDGNWKSLGRKETNGHINLDGVVYTGSKTNTTDTIHFLSASSLNAGNGYANLNLDFTTKDVCEGVWTVTTSTPVLSSFLGNEEIFDLDEGTTPRTFWYTNAGENVDTYTLYSTPDMLGFASLVKNETDFSTKTVKLGADITMNKGKATVERFIPSEAETELLNWTPVNVTGTFDGDGHTISGVYVNTNKGNAGLFASVTGTVQNLRLQNSYINCTDNTSANYNSTNRLLGVGSIAGSLAGTLDTVYSNAIIIKTGGFAGGLVGTVYDLANGKGKSTITNACYAGEIQADQVVGGIVGAVVNTSAELGHCLNIGSISGGDATGGLCGYMWHDGSVDQSPVLTLKDSLNIGKLNLTDSDATYFGSAVGYIRNVHTGNYKCIDVYDTYGLNDQTVNNATWSRFAYKNSRALIAFDGQDLSSGNEVQTRLWTMQYIMNRQTAGGTKMNLSFQTAEGDNTDKYWVDREGKIPMLESFEDLLTNVTF